MPRPASSRVSSTVTKSNPRPRKYASASERQAAYRARAPEMCFRAEAKTVETLDKIAQTLDQSRADVLLSMTKFALANHDWARFGLTHKPLPFGYGVTDDSRKENPMKKPTPAQLAARAKFAAAARAGTLKRKGAAKKTTRKTNPTDPAPYGVSYTSAMSGTRHTSHYKTKAAAVKDANALNVEGAKNIRVFHYSKGVGAVDIDWKKVGARMGRPLKRKTNPDNRTVSGIILDQLGGNRFIAMTGTRMFVGGPSYLEFVLPRNASGAKKTRIEYHPGSDLYSMVFIKPDRTGMNAKEVARFDDVYADQLRDLFTQTTGLYTSLGTMGRKPNPATGRKGSGTKLNPSKVAKLYTVSRADANGAPVYHIAHFRKMAEAKQYAQAYADANKTRVAITSKAL